MISSQLNKVILKALENGDKYGLEIIKDIEENSNGQIVIKQPSLYSALRRLENKGFITSFWRDSELGGRRHYYTLSELGKAELKKPETQKVTLDLNALRAEAEIRRRDKANEQIIEKEIIKEIVIEKAEPVIKNTKVFEPFEPSASSNFQQNSFTQQMRSQSKPAELKIEEPKPGNIKSDPSPLPDIIDDSFIKEDFLQKVPSKKDDINYKDILGDLDADVPEPAIVEKEEIKKDISPKNEQMRSEFAKQISEILLDKKSKETPPAPILETQRKKTLEEISKRYNLNEYEKNKIKQVNTKQAGYHHIKQESITIKPYNSQITVVSKPKEYRYINYNKLNLFRGLFVAILYVIGIIIAYFTVKNSPFFSPDFEFLYLVYGLMSIVYFCIILLLYAKNYNKKVRKTDLNFGINLIYRLIVAIILATFIIAICLCFGMGSNLLDAQYFTLWLLPMIATVNILISWVIGIVMSKCPAFQS